MNQVITRCRQVIQVHVPHEHAYSIHWSSYVSCDRQGCESESYAKSQVWGQKKKKEDDAAKKKTDTDEKTKKPKKTSKTKKDKSKKAKASTATREELDLDEEDEEEDEEEEPVIEPAPKRKVKKTK